jgi:hypothetical protein
VLRSPLTLRVLRTFGLLELDCRRQLAATAYCARSFFDVHLRGAPASGLNNLTQFPEIEVVP